MGTLTKAQSARIAELAPDGEITPDAVVADARNKSSPLHSLFEWDKTKAHALYLLDRAREVIRGVKVEITIHQRVLSISRYSRNPEAPASMQGYITLEKLRTDEDVARDAVFAEFQRAAAALTRARDFAAILRFDGDVNAVIIELVAARDRLEERPSLSPPTQ